MRRSVAASTIACLSLLGAGAVVAAGTNPAVAGPSPVVGVGAAQSYDVASWQAAFDYVRDLLVNNTDVNMVVATQWYSSGLTHDQVVVLAGDSVTWHEGVGMTETGGVTSFGPNAASWAIDLRSSDFTAARAVLVPEPDAGRASGLDSSYTGCATTPMAARDGATLIDAWCYGGLYYTVTLNNVTAADDGKKWAASTYDSTGVVAAYDVAHDEQITGPSGVYLAGPSDTSSGTHVAEEYLYVLDPRLELAKQVCVSSVLASCDPAVDADWVDSQEVPPGSTQAVFRITVTNTGNVDLMNVHIAKDVVQPAAADASKVGTPTLAGGGPVDGALVASTLTANGGTASLVVTVPITGNLQGRLVNVATANADLPPTVLVYDGEQWPTEDPNGNPLVDRFTGNPEVGDPAPHLVPSNQADADVYELFPAIALTKWVCQAGTGCATPSGNDLTSLAAETPAAGWVKATTVPVTADAQWLLVITNTGTLSLDHVTLSREDFAAGGAGYGTTTDECAQGTDLGTLAPDQSTTVTCTTADITNTEAWDSGQNVVNTAQVSATPEDPEGLLSDLATRPAITAESSAQVNTQIRMPGNGLGDDPDGGPGRDGSRTPRLLGATGANAVGVAVVGLVLLLAGTGLVVTRTLRARRLAR